MNVGLRLWIIVSALLCAGGWILSWAHELNAAGYAVLLLLVVGIVIVGCSQWRSRPRRSLPQLVRRWLRRFRRPAPLLFFALAIASFVGGALYVPFDRDTSSYRIPRILHWLGSNRWHWIHATDERLNFAGNGYEWLATPLVALSKTDRLFFLPNAISYLLLPGLIFSVFRRLGVAGKVAWWWMWLLASGWCYALQAGSSVNDSFAAVYALASVDFALRARERSSAPDLCFAVVAAALLSGAKQSALPLLLASATAIFLAWKAFVSRPWVIAAIAAASLLCSGAPLFYFNYRHRGAWSGLRKEEDLSASEEKSLKLPTLLPNAFWGLVGNAFCLPVQNLLPPMFPLADGWNRTMVDFQRTRFGSHFRDFEAFGMIGHSIGENNAALGLGVTGLTVISAAWLLARPREGGASRCGKIRRPLCLISGAAGIATLFFMAKVGTFENGRQLAPYYLLLFPPFLTLSGHARLIRLRWWRTLATLAMLSAAGLLLVDRGRPLFPAQTVFAWLSSKFPGWRGAARLGEAYRARSSIEEARRLFPDTIPKSELLVGYACALGPYESGIWFPLWHCRVERVGLSDTAESLAEIGVHYVVVQSERLNWKNESLDDWMNRYGGELVDRRDFFVGADFPPASVYLVHLRGLSAGRAVTRSAAAGSAPGN